MVYTISNDRLCVSVSSRGAELQSIRSVQSRREYLWYGDPEYWEDRAPTLFPYIGRLVNGICTCHGKSYKLPIHGFAPTAEFSLAYQEADRIGFRLSDSPETLAMYPFKFSFTVHYALRGNALETTYEIENRGAETMYYAIGGHPGVRVPLDDESEFTDWRIQFEAPCKPLQIGLTDDCFISCEDAPYPLSPDGSFALRHDLFDRDAIILRGMAPSLRIVSEKSRRNIRFTFDGFEYIGFWHECRTDAPYVCLEPWSSLPARADTIEELTQQPSLLSLEPEQTANKSWTLEINE